MITVVDYKAGNLTSVMKALAALGEEALVTADPDAVNKADKLILPGVGHFQATALLEERGLKSAMVEKMQQGSPFLGICVGLQWLFSGSTEAPETPGAAVFEGICERFSGEMKIPHVGWNSLSIRNGSQLLAGIEDGSFVYFTHSYRAPVISDTAAVTDYGQPFSAAVERGNVMGVQFHPEKSSAAGMRVLENFLRF